MKLQASLLILLICFSSCRKNPSLKERNAFTVETVIPKPVQNEGFLQAFGNITPEEKNDVYTQVEGLIENILVKEGDFIRKGQPLVILSNLQYEIKKTQYENEAGSCKANIELCKAEISDKEKEIRGNLLSIEKNQQELSQKLLELENENSTLSKNEILFSSGAISESSIEELRLEKKSLETEIASLKKNIEILQLGMTESDLISNNIVPSGNKEEFTRQILELNTKNERASLLIAEAQYSTSLENIKSIERILDALIIRSNISGIVGLINFNEGEYIQEHENILSIIKMDEPYLTVNLQEKNMKDIVPGTKAVVNLPSIDYTEETIVEQISPLSDTETGNFSAKIRLHNKGNLIKAGMFGTSIIENVKIDFPYCFPETCIIDSESAAKEIFLLKNNYLYKKQIADFKILNGFVFANLEPECEIVLNPKPNMQEGDIAETL